jgi:hypothetical protein
MFVIRLTMAVVGIVIPPRPLVRRLLPATPIKVEVIVVIVFKLQ